MMDKKEKIDKLMELLLDRYNGESENPVDLDDTYFKSYLLGYFTYRLSNKELDEDIKYFESKIGQPA